MAFPSAVIVEPVDGSENALELRHPTDGFLRLAIEGDVAHIRCRWPFDMDAGDWIVLSVELTLDSYRDAIERFGESGVGKAPGSSHGFLELRSVRESYVQVEVADDHSNPPTRLSLVVESSREDFALQLMAGFSAARRVAGANDGGMDPIGRGPREPLMEYLDRAIDLRAEGRSAEAFDIATEGLAAARDDTPASLVGRMMLVQGNALADLGRHQEAEIALGRASELFLQEQLSPEYVQAMIGRGRVLAERGEAEAAVTFFEQIPRDELPPTLESQVLNNLGLLHRRLGNLGDAIDFLRRDASLCARTNDAYGAGVAYFNLAGALLEADREREASVAALDAAKLFDGIGRDDLAIRARALSER